MPLLILIHWITSDDPFLICDINNLCLLSFIIDQPNSKFINFIDVSKNLYLISLIISFAFLFSTISILTFFSSSYFGFN